VVDKPAPCAQTSVARTSLGHAPCAEDSLKKSNTRKQKGGFRAGRGRENCWSGTSSCWDWDWDWDMGLGSLVGSSLRRYPPSSTLPILPCLLPVHLTPFQQQGPGTADTELIGFCSPGPPAPGWNVPAQAVTRTRGLEHQ
jgi:hypothetical protein